MKFRIAFQGGGAKFFPLLEAVEAIKSQVSTNNHFEVDSISGASAGCLAAVCLAADLDLELTKKFLKSDAGLKLFGATFPQITTTSMVSKVLMGKTLFKAKKLEELVFKIFAVNGLTDRKEKVALRYPMTVAITDLRSSELKMIELGGKSLEGIVKNICDSCAIPFVLKNHKSRDGWEFVDGGLFENFPVGDLVSDEFPKSRVLGFTFRKPPPLTIDEASFLSYSKAVISTAIDSNIDSSLKLIDARNVFQIRTNLGTFEFVKSLKFYLEETEISKSRRNEIKGWLAEVCTRERQVEARFGQREQATVPNNFEMMCDALSGLFLGRHVVHDKENLNAYIQLNSLFPEFSPTYSEYDYFVTETLYDVPSNGFDCVQLMTTTTTAEEMGLHSKIEAYRDDDKPIEIFTFPISQGSGDKRTLSFGIFFKEMILPSQTSQIKLVKKELIKGGFEGLTSNGVEHIEISASTGNIRKAQIFIGLPQNALNRYKLDIAAESYDERTKEINFLPGQLATDFSTVPDVGSSETQISGFVCSEEVEGSSWFSIEIRDLLHSN